MVKIESIEYGLYPRSEQARLSISKWERKVMDHHSLGKLLDDEKRELLKHFRESGVDYYTDPLINWQDILRTVASLSLGTPFEKISRYRETNTFYRQPYIENYPSFREVKEEESTPDSHLPGSMYVTDDTEHYIYFLPGIESFVNMSFLSPELRRERVMDSLLEIYLDLIKNNHMKKVLLFEPYPDSSLYKGYKDIFDSSQVFYVRYGMTEELFSGSQKLKPYSLLARNEKELKVAAKHSEVPGIALIDSQNTYLEDSGKVREKAAKASSQLGLDTILVTHTEYLDFLPRIIADRKIQIIGKVGD